MDGSTALGLQPPLPVLTIQLFLEERKQLLALLSDLAEADWQRATACPGWSVKDIALHLLADDLNALSRLRDRFSPHGPGHDDLVVFINQLNDTWLGAARRLSVGVLHDMLEWTGNQTYAYFASLDPLAPGGPVEWIGPEPAPHWLGIAREYTERWVHQQQIREAVGSPLLSDPRLFTPVIATFARALPRTYRDAPALRGTVVSLVIEGEAGGAWMTVRADDGTWRLYAGMPSALTTATVRMSQDTAWRLFTRALSVSEAERRVEIEGDRVLGQRVLDMVAILA